MSVTNELPARLVNSQSAAHYLSFSARYLRQLVYRGELKPVVRLRKLMRFDVRDLDAWIERQKGGAQ